MATHFRQLGPDHTAQLTECLLRWHRSEGRSLDLALTRRSVARTLADNQGWHIWLIEHKEEVVGYLAVNFRPVAPFEATRAYVAGLYVEPQSRHLGLGRQARRLVSDLGRWLRVQVFDFDTDGEAKHALSITRHGSVARSWTDNSDWKASA